MTIPDLRAIKTFPQLVKYLRDELEWPIEGDDFEDLTFDYSAEELGLDNKTAAKLREIKQLRPLETKQPWGIFFVGFEPKKLPVVALRRILRSLVVKKRAVANKAQQAAWQKHDLLFISTYGEHEHRDITFAHFSDESQQGDLPVLRVLNWDDEDTLLHTAHTEKVLREKLQWPANPGDLETWRNTWSSAFTLKHQQVIKTSKELAVRLAELASKIRKRAKSVLAIETEKGPLKKLHAAFKAALIHDLSEDDFADMYAQTISYGLLTARISRPSGLVADNLKDMVPVTNPFLKELLETFLSVGGRKGKIDFDELGVNEVVQLLRDAEMEAVLRDFGDRNPEEDPVIHFYELFLKEYDPEKRMKRGVFYTPKPVVSFIVRSVHELLKKQLGLVDGLADVTTWREIATQVDSVQIPEGVSPTTPFVQILDPAIGTGTFLVEVIEIIYETMCKKWLSAGHMALEIPNLWNEYVPKHLLPRLYGFELMMAPYAIAHMKLGLKLYETGYRFGSNERARVYLTNSLEAASDDKKQTDFAEWAPALAHEAAAVNEIKRHKHFTVVIGNPPYSVSSWNTGQWITNLAEDYKRTVRAEESQIQALSNDYIKFLRFGEWHIERTNTGILGLITGHGYLSGTQPRDLRNHVSTSFDRCYCLDLHGSIRRAGTHDSEDEPVFEIMTGVAILVGCRAISHQQRAITTLESLTGPLEKKFAFLRDHNALNTSLGARPHSPSAPYFYFAAAATAHDIREEYEQWPDLPSIFGTGNRHTDKETFWATGFASQQDQLAMSFTREELEIKMAALANSRSFDELGESYRLCTTNQWNYSEAKEFARRGLWKEYVGQVLYRPFDRQWTVLHKHVLTILRKQVMSQLAGGDRNLGLVSSRAVNDLSFAHCFVTNEPVDKIFISSKTSTNAYVFPLFLREEGIFGKKRRLNLSARFLTLLAEKLAVARAAEDGLPAGITAEDIFHYIYTVFYSPVYRSRYAEFLKIDFPRLPLTGNLNLFRALARLGGELVVLHLLESPKLDKAATEFLGGRNPEVEKVSWLKRAVWIDKAQTIGFNGIAEEVWNFHVGGYQVCEKWLKDRKGRTLSKADIEHYQKIVVAIRETIRIMAEIDKVIDAHGGWPGAFATAKGAKA